MQQLSVLVLFLSSPQAYAYFQTLSPMTDLLQPFIHSLQPETLSVVLTPERSEVGFNLSDYQWQHRIVLIFAPSEQSPAYKQQMQQWEAHQHGIQERALKLVEVLGSGESRADGRPITSSSAERLREQFGFTIEDFAVILVGKDGTEKQRERVPVALAVLFRRIDAMPMRQQEIRS